MFPTNQFRRRSSSALVRHLAVFAASVGVAGVASAANCADAPVSGKKYYLVNEGSGLPLEVSAWSDKDGAGVAQWSAASGPYNFNQQWTVTSMGEGIWSIRPAHSSKSLDVYGWSSSDGGTVVQWSYTGNSNQQWVISPAGGGTYKIASNFSKKVLTVADKKAGTSLQQSADQWSAQQKWYFNPVDGACRTAATGNFGSFMGFTKMLIGAQMSDASTTKAPWDVRYRYLASLPVPDDSYMTKCPSTGVHWWACWDNTRAPGTQLKEWTTEGKSATWQGASYPRLSMFTYYMMKSAAGGENDLTPMTDPARLKRYLTDWRFLLQTIGQERVILQIEPDLWGFVRGKNKDPHAVPAQVTAANPTDCPYYENSAAGLGRCMIAMARKYAPNAAVGLHASSWNHTESGNAEEIGNYMLELGAGTGDFVSTDPSDRDAGWYRAEKGMDTFWNDQRFATYLAWSKKLAETVGRPTVMWQIPLGNWQQNNTYQHWQDNKVDYVFGNLDKVADAHVVGLFFGSGDTPQTTPETDGGHLFSRTQDYYRSGGVKLR
jgi:hypothetical protein